MSKDWKEENGGHLEIWDGENASKNDARLKSKKTAILPSFNKLIIFHNNDYSWHGNPDPISCKNGEKRIFLTLSYLCSNPRECYENTRQKAFFIARPNDPYDEEKNELRLLRADPEKYKNACLKQAKKFDTKIFIKKMKKQIFK